MNRTVGDLVVLLGELTRTYVEADEVGQRAQQALVLGRAIQEVRGEKLERLLGACRELAPHLDAADRARLRSAAAAVVRDATAFTHALDQSLKRVR